MPNPMPRVAPVMNATFFGNEINVPFHSKNYQRPRLPQYALKKFVERRVSIEHGNLLVGPASRAGLATANVALFERKSGSARRTYKCRLFASLSSSSSLRLGLSAFNQSHHAKKL